MAARFLPALLLRVNVCAAAPWNLSGSLWLSDIHASVFLPQEIVRCRSSAEAICKLSWPPSLQVRWPLRRSPEEAAPTIRCSSGNGGRDSQERSSRVKGRCFQFHCLDAYRIIWLSFTIRPAPCSGRLHERTMSASSHGLTECVSRKVNGESGCSTASVQDCMLCDQGTFGIFRSFDTLILSLDVTLPAPHPMLRCFSGQ